MREVSYFPGCSLDGTAKEYGESTEALFESLGISLRELEDWNCCGSSSAHMLNSQLALDLSSRNLDIADKAGLDLVVPCSACFQRLKAAEKHLLSSQNGQAHPYSGKVHIKHLVDFLFENVGEKEIISRVKKPLTGLKAVCYYGCLTTRPPEITGSPEPENPQAMDKIMECLGASLKNWSYKTDCCGGSLVLTRPDLARGMTRKLLDMAEEAGAECIVTGCPMCFSNLDNQQKCIAKDSGKTYNTPIFYISELIGAAFGHPDTRKWLRRHMVDPRPMLKQKRLI